VDAFRSERGGLLIDCTHLADALLEYLGVVLFGL
jgi:hypothetical protein